MTSKERLQQMLIDNGMDENAANDVLTIAIPNIEKAISKRYQITWDKPAKEYPDVLYNIMWMYVKKSALKWIEENAPEAWYKAMFQ